jgi:prophage regulatory protein
MRVPNERFLSVKEAAAITSLSRATMYRLVDKDAFPRPRQLAPGRVGFRASEVEEWVATRRITIKRGQRAAS